MTASDSVTQLLQEMRERVSYTDVATMPIPLYEKIKEVLRGFANEPVVLVCDTLSSSIDTTPGSVATMETVTMTNTWQPIETAPRDGTEILACNPKWSSEPTVIKWRKNDWYCIAEGELVIESQGDCYIDYKTFHPSHWMPLPKPPSDNRKVRV